MSANQTAELSTGHSLEYGPKFCFGNKYQFLLVILAYLDWEAEYSWMCFGTFGVFQDYNCDERTF